MKRWVNVILKYIIKSNRTLENPMQKGFCDWIILAEKIK